MDAIALIGRAAMSVIFIVAGFFKAAGFAKTVGMMGGLGIPVPEAAAAITVLIELGGGLLLLAGFQVRAVALVLAIWCIATAFVAHSDLGDMNQQIHFMKNVAIFGGLLQVLAFGGGRLSIDGRRR